MHRTAAWARLGPLPGLAKARQVAAQCIHMGCKNSLPALTATTEYTSLQKFAGIRRIPDTDDISPFYPNSTIDTENGRC